MSAISKVVYKSFIKPFYRENAGTFLFVFAMFFFIVGTVDGAGLFKYHYTLIKGILHIKIFLAGALLLWSFYARKCTLFIKYYLQQPSYQFLSIFKTLPKQQQYRLFFVTDLILLLPMNFYILLVIAEGIYLNTWVAVMLITIFLITVCLLCPFLHIRLLNHPGSSTTGWISRFTTLHFINAFYPNILIHSVFKLQKLAWLGIKLFTCGFLYFMAVNNHLAADDIRITFLFFSAGILANGVFVNRLRMLEEQQLSFYRSLPVSVFKRFIQYAYFCLLLIIPEILTLVLITPHHFHIGDAISFGWYAFTTILLLIAISFIQQTTLKYFTKILMLLFFTGYFIMMSGNIILTCILFTVCAVIFFLFAYYKFEATTT